MPQLNWIGKDKIRDYDSKIPFHLLQRRYSYDESGQHEDDNGSENMIVHGDNLLALKSLLPRYEGRVDLIYIDPPYNTGNEGWHYNDNVSDPRLLKWLNEVVGKEGEDLCRHDKWLCMMYPRLKLLKRFLSERGAIFISIDDNELSHLMLICDEIFGRQCFKADVSWQKVYSTRNDSKGFVAEVEHVLVFSKKPDWQPAKLARSEEMDKKYKNPDNDVAAWRPDNAYAPGAYTHQGMVYAIQHPFTGEMLYPTVSNCWRYQQSAMLEIMNKWTAYQLVDLHDEERRAAVCGTTADEVRQGVKGIVLVKPLEESRKDAEAVLKRGQWPVYYFTKGGNGGISRKTYLDSVSGTPPTNLWSYEECGHTDGAKKDLKAIFSGKSPLETPKPYKLIEHILAIASYPDSIVLDSFAGSGTTAQAVLRKNQEEQVKRRFILIEGEEYAEPVTAERVRRVIQGYAHSERKTVFEHRLTVQNLKHAEQALQDAKAAADEARAEGWQITGPKLEGDMITVTAQTKGTAQVPGTGGSFSFYELGARLFLDDGTLNPDAPVDAVREYIYYTETHQPLPVIKDATTSSLLGSFASAEYHLLYDPFAVTALNEQSLGEIAAGTSPDNGYIIYADTCLLSQEELSAAKVVFKKIPRDVARI